MPPHADVAQTVELKDSIAFKRREFACTASSAPVRRFDSGRLHQGGKAHVFTSLGERAPRSVDNHEGLGMDHVRPRRRSTSISMRLLM